MYENKSLIKGRLAGLSSLALNKALAHHDGFDLFNSKYQRWNPTQYSPKTFVHRWADAAKRVGLPFGLNLIYLKAHYRLRFLNNDFGCKPNQTKSRNITDLLRKESKNHFNNYLKSLYFRKYCA